MGIVEIFLVIIGIPFLIRPIENVIRRIVNECRPYLL